MPLLSERCAARVHLRNTLTTGPVGHVNPIKIKVLSFLVCAYIFFFI